MSEFDKEAERERLREKYERDEEKRAATQRMSELLLKGATMTNSHCETCGDPIFRHDGQEFCPTCRAGATGTDADAQADAADAQADAADATGASDAAASTGVEGTEPSTETDAAAAAASTEATANATQEATNRANRAAPREAAPSPDDRAVTAQAGGRDATPADGEPSLSDARASLSRTLVRFSRAAEGADDPRRATELLGAAREAAATLAELERCRS
jgi:uncharacterized Zn finger protein (UPF0148 family)